MIFKTFLTSSKKGSATERKLAEFFLSLTHYLSTSVNSYITLMGGSPGVVVMGGNSGSKGRGVESQHRILDRYFSQIFVIKIAMFF